MSTFLQLSVKARRECGVAGTGPTSVTTQTGILDKIVNWVAESYTEIQNRHPNWRWLRKPFTFDSVASTEAYAYTSVTDTEAGSVIARFSRWWSNDAYNPFQIYLTSGGVSGERRLLWLPYENFKAIYRIGSQNNGAPTYYSIDNNNKIVLGPKPDAIYTVTGEFQRSAQVLAANADTPEMPTDYHMLVVYEAMMKYAGYESAPEVMLRGSNEGRRMMRALERNQLPMLQLAEPLA